jgi:hypothetical protein
MADALSPDAEIVRVREHLHSLNERVGVIALANANVAGDVKAMKVQIDGIAKTSDDTQRAIADVLKPLVEKVGVLQLLVYGGVGLLLSGLGYALLATVLKASPAR